MSQTTAPLVNMVAGEDGLIADSVSPCQVETLVNASAPVYFGRLVSLDASAQGLAKVPAAAGDVTNSSAGVVVRRLTKVTDPTLALPGYAAKDSVPVLRKGKIWVRVESGVTRGAAAFARHAVSNQGQFRHDADGGNATLVPSAYYRTSASAGQLAMVEINLP